MPVRFTLILSATMLSLAGCASPASNPPAFGPELTVYRCPDGADCRAVLVKLDIDERGVPHNARIARSQETAEMNEAVLRHAAKFRFQPAREGRKPVYYRDHIVKVVIAYSPAGEESSGHVQ